MNRKEARQSESRKALVFLLICGLFVSGLFNNVGTVDRFKATVPTHSISVVWKVGGEEGKGSDGTLATITHEHTSKTSSLLVE